MTSSTDTKRKSVPKASRLSVRASAVEKGLIAHAARIKGITMSEFVLEQSLTAARQVIADQAQFTLRTNEWKTLCAALDAPPKSVPALRRLLTRSGLFDVQR